MNKVSIIAAVDDAMGIGKNNKLPWHIPEDFRWFKAKTLRKPIIMGRATHESIGKILPGRQNLILSRDPFYSVSNDHRKAMAFECIEDTLEYCKERNSEEIMIIGGAQIYKLAMPLIDRMYLTRIDGDYACDTFFPKTDWMEWELTFEEDFADNGFCGTFQIFDRKWRNK